MTDTLVIDPASEIWATTLDLADFKFGDRKDWYVLKRPWKRLLWWLRDNSAVVTQIVGDTGCGKTYTALTSRGRAFVLDFDNQIYLYQAAEKFRDKIAAARYSMDPNDYTREVVSAWCKKAGISFPFDVVLTAREGEEFDRAGAPTGRVKAEGEQRKTRYEVPFQFRMSVNGKGVNVATCVKSKCSGLKIGSAWEAPNLEAIYTETGVYALCDEARAMAPPMGDDTSRETQAEKLLGGSLTGRNAWDILTEMVASRGVEEVRKDPEARRLFSQLSPAQQALFKRTLA